MTNKQKAVHILALIMDELNMPENATIGDVAHALSIIDPDGEVMSILLPVMRSAVVDEIKQRL